MLRFFIDTTVIHFGVVPMLESFLSSFFLIAASTSAEAVTAQELKDLLLLLGPPVSLIIAVTVLKKDVSFLAELLKRVEHKVELLSDTDSDLKARVSVLESHNKATS